MRIKWLPLCLALALALAACGETTTPEPPSTPEPVETPAPSVQPRVFTLPRTEETMHPILSRDKTNLDLAGLMWEGLYALDSEFAPQKVLCESADVSEDGLVWTFTLKSGVTFSDGSPLTAQEAADSLALAMTPASRFANRLAGVRAVEARDGAVAVTLTRPNGALPALLDIPVVKGEGDLPLGTGPYVLEGEGETARLTARRDWWGEKEPPVQTIPLLTLREADGLIYAFDTGELSLVTTDFTGASALGFAGDGYEALDCPTTTMVFVGYNCARGPCADPALRRALSRGMDRNTVAVALYSRHAAAAALPAHPQSELYDQQTAELLSYSPRALADGLAEAGWSKGEDGRLTRGRNTLALTFVVNTDNSFRLAAAEYLAGELERAGVTVELKKLNWNEYQQALAAGDFDLYLGAAAMTADFDPAPLIETGGSLNYGRYVPGETAQLLAAFQAAGGKDRSAAARDLYQQLAQDAPFTALCFKSQSVLTRWGMVSGMTPTQQDPFYGLEWRIQG